MIRFKWCMNPFSVICWYKTPVGVRVEDFTHQLHCCCLQEEMHGFLSISWSCSPLWYSSFETAYKSLCELTSTSSCLPYVSLMLAWFQWLAQGQTVICSENYHHCSWRICSWGQKGRMILMLHITFFFFFCAQKGIQFVVSDDSSAPVYFHWFTCKHSRAL